MFSRMLSLSTAILAYATVTIAQATDSAVAQPAPATQRPNITTLFAGYLSSSAEIYLPSDPVVTQRWTLHDEPTYFGAIKVGTEYDVVTIVRIATKFGIPFLATGGGHGTSITLGKLNNGLEIDMSQLSSVDVDTSNNQITIGGGTRFSQVVDPLYAAQKEMQIGTALCVGMVGATLGGGVSQQQGMHGLLIDTLVSVRLVTASGNAITVSKTQNPDLFFGLRGAGQNFGIVTSATYKIFDWTNGGQVLSANFEYEGTTNASLWQILQSFDNNLPALLAINYAVAYDPPSGTSGFVINANYYGPKDEGLKYLQPFIDLKPVLSSIQMLPSTGVLADAYFGLDKTGCVDGQYINAYTIGLKQTTPATFESFFADLSTFNAQHATDVHVGYTVHRWSQQAVLAVPEGDTAYPWRQIKMHIQIESNYASNNTALDKTVDDFSQAARAKYQQTSGFSTLATYSNFAHGDEGPDSWYGAQNLGKLKDLKKKWDPHQVFSFYNGLSLN